MTLRRLGFSAQDQRHDIQIRVDGQSRIAKLLERLNDYMALMTNEPDPPSEESETDTST